MFAAPLNAHERLRWLRGRLIHGKSGKLPPERRMKRQHDVFRRDAEFQELVGDYDLRAVVLNPDFLVFDVHVNHAAVNVPLVFPADIEHMIMIANRIETQFDFDRFI